MMRGCGSNALGGVAVKDIPQGIKAKAGLSNIHNVFLFAMVYT